MTSIVWNCKRFEELDPYELYCILQLRNEVFVVEQHCVFQDADDKDLLCYHLMGWHCDKLLAYSRIVPPQISYSESSIGRIVTSPKIRGSGIGRQLVEESIRELYKLYGRVPIKIGAQMYLKSFYEYFGFVQISEVYIEDDIQHVEMLLKSQ